MVIVRKAQNRGLTETEWLKSYHTFSFEGYYDPEFLGFGNLLVINEDTVASGQGFGLHNHQNMEIISYVVSGSIEHKDSMGQSAVLVPGEVQRMSAGTGVRHSEMNPSNIPVHFLQIWILPKEINTPPSYEQKKIITSSNDLILIGSGEQEEGAVLINQDVNLYCAHLKPNNFIAYQFESENYGWLQLIKGNIVINEQMLFPGDGVALINEPKVLIECLEAAELLLFDFKQHAGEKIYE